MAFTPRVSTLVSAIATMYCAVLAPFRVSADEKILPREPAWLDAKLVRPWSCENITLHNAVAKIADDLAALPDPPMVVLNNGNQGEKELSAVPTVSPAVSGKVGARRRIVIIANPNLSVFNVDTANMTHREALDSICTAAGSASWHFCAKANAIEITKGVPLRESRLLGSRANHQYKFSEAQQLLVEYNVIGRGNIGPRTDIGPLCMDKEQYQHIKDTPVGVSNSDGEATYDDLLYSCLRLVADQDRRRDREQSRSEVVRWWRRDLGGITEQSAMDENALRLAVQSRNASIEKTARRFGKLEPVPGYPELLRAETANTPTTSTQPLNDMRQKRRISPSAGLAVD